MLAKVSMPKIMLRFHYMINFKAVLLHGRMMCCRLYHLIEVFQQSSLAL